MNIDLVSKALMWSTVINFGVLVLWFVFWVSSRRWMYQLHSRFFPITFEQYSMVHFCGMAAYKLGILAFNLVPFIALYIIKR